jgi:hypothetical protein
MDLSPAFRFRTSPFLCCPLLTIRRASVGVWWPSFLDFGGFSLLSSCPSVRFCLLLVTAAHDCIIDRNSKGSSRSSPLPPPCAGARDRGLERRGGVRPIDGQLAGGRQVEDGTALGWK